MTAISLHLVPNILLQPQAQHLLCQTVVMRAAELVTIRDMSFLSQLKPVLHFYL